MSSQTTPDSWPGAAMGPLWLRELAADRTLIGEALDVARRQSAVGVLPFLLSHVAVDALASDRWAEAEGHFHEAIDLARETGQRTDLAFALARLGWLEARRGNEPECRSHTGEARALAGELDLGLTEIWSLAALGDLEFGLGRLDAALNQFQQQQVALRTLSVGDVDLSPEPELVEVNLRLGRPDQARFHLSNFEQGALAKGQPWSLARAARCRGLLVPDDELDRQFEEALALHDQTPDLFERARNLARLRRSAAPGPAEDQGSPAAASGADPLRPARCRAVVGPGRCRARRDRRDRPPAAPLDPQSTHPPGTANRGHCWQPAARSRDGGRLAVHQSQDNRVSPSQRVPQAWHQLPGRAGRKDLAGAWPTKGVPDPFRTLRQPLRTARRPRRLVEAMGIEPTNLLHAMQALYQLSYAPRRRSSLAAPPPALPMPRAPAATPPWTPSPATAVD